MPTPGTAERPPFFVLNPGRSGSKAIAAALSQAPDCVCLHEPEPALIEEATRWRYGEIDDGYLIEVLARTRRLEEGQVYGETNNKLALLVPLLDRAFPGCRFVWLVRDGRDFVTSVGRRGFHVPSERTSAKSWKRWRPQGDWAGDVDAREWARMDPFERCCWHWSWINRLIGTDLSAVGADRWRLARLEDLGAQIDGIASFLGLYPAVLTLERSNETPTRDGRPPTRLSWPEWDDAERATFERWCGSQMNALYPGWRDGGGSWRQAAASSSAG